MRISDWSSDVCSSDLVVAKGEDGIAALIRKTAEEAGVPILQNVQLARGLNEKVELDNYIGSEFFDAVAEVLHWADGMRRETGGGGDTPSGGSSPPHAPYALKAFFDRKRVV